MDVSSNDQRTTQFISYFYFYYKIPSKTPRLWPYSGLRETIHTYGLMVTIPARPSAQVQHLPFHMNASPQSRGEPFTLYLHGCYPWTQLGFPSGEELHDFKGNICWNTIFFQSISNVINKNKHIVHVQNKLNSSWIPGKKISKN